MRSQQRLSSVRATAYRHDAHNDQRAAVTPAAQADARYEAQAAETMTASRRVRQCFAGGSVAAAGKMLYLQPDKIIKKLRREQRSKTHVIGHIGTQLGTPQLCVGETPWLEKRAKESQWKYRSALVYNDVHGSGEPSRLHRAVVWRSEESLARVDARASECH